MTTTSVASPHYSGKKIALSTAIAFVIAGAILVTVVLPAEYGIDPLKSGQLLGLTALRKQQTEVIHQQPGTYRSDTMSFVLAPFESVEYKYRLEQGATLLYAWQANGELVFDFHAEPDGSPPGYAESFDQRQSAQEQGSYTAPFPGIHGWFWENRGKTDVRIDLNTVGFYSHAIEFRDGFQNKKNL